MDTDEPEALRRSSASARWYPPAEMTAEQVRMEDYECQRDATVQRSSGYYLKGVGSPYASGFFASGPELDYKLYEKCLEAHGWTRQELSSRVVPATRPRIAPATTPKDPFANIRNADDMRQHLDSWRRTLDLAVEKGTLTKDEADRLYQEREEFLSKQLNTTK